MLTMCHLSGKLPKCFFGALRYFPFFNWRIFFASHKSVADVYSAYLGKRCTGIQLWKSIFRQSRDTSKITKRNLLQCRCMMHRNCLKLSDFMQHSDRIVVAAVIDTSAPLHTLASSIGFILKWKIRKETTRKGNPCLFSTYFCGNCKRYTHTQKRKGKYKLNGNEIEKQKRTRERKT